MDSSCLIKHQSRCSCESIFWIWHLNCWLWLRQITLHSADRLRKTEGCKSKDWGFPKRKEFSSGLEHRNPVWNSSLLACPVDFGLKITTWSLTWIEYASLLYKFQICQTTQVWVSALEFTMSMSVSPIGSVSLETH